MLDPLLSCDRLKQRISSFCSFDHSALSSKSRYRYTPLKGNQIRLLKLHPGEPESHICCSLRNVDLLAYEDVAAESTIEGWEQFDTISYVWGTGSQKVDITCDQYTARVTVNLADALRRFRDPQEDQILWADALCINQKDNDERAAQVKLMGLIYFKARRVRIWLGKDDEVEELHRVQHAVDLIQRYNRLYETCLPDPGSKKLQVLSESLFSEPGSIEHPHWTALRRLFERPWFTRVWVVQELGLSRNALFYCGKFTFSRDELEYFERVMLYSKAGAALWRDINMQMVHLGMDYWRSAWSNIRIELGEDPREAETFFDILRSARGLQCTEHKDMIYAFLGHPSAFKRQLLDVDPYYWYPTNYYDNRRTIVLPNYDKSYKFPRLCLDLAITAMRDYDFGLNVLSNIAHNNMTIDMKFPSWVPRWDLMDLPSQFYGSQVYYKASKDLPITSFSIDNLGALSKRPRLSVKALQLGRVWVTLRAPTTAGPEHLAKTMAQLLGDIPRRGDVSYISPPDSTSYPYDNAFLLALATTLTAGLTTGYDIDTRPADEHSRHHLNAFKAYYRQQVAIGSGSQPDPEDEEQAAYFFEKFGRSASHRVLFLTLEGRFGLGPAISDWRDEVWLPMGAKMPFVLRPTGNGNYRIVGQTFLYGVMRGEAVEEKSEEDFETVVLE